MRGHRGAHAQQQVVAEGPDFDDVDGDGVAAVVPGGDTVETQPVAFEVQAHNLRTAVWRRLDDAHHPGINDVQRLAGSHEKD